MANQAAVCDFDPRERPTLSLDEVNPFFGLSRTTGYELARRGGYPAPLLKIGSRYRVITVGLLRVLQLEEPTEVAS